MPTINNIEFLTLPQQVSKNKRDISALQTEVADEAVSVAGEFSNVYIGLNAIDDKVDEANDIIEALLVATEDTGWQPLEVTNASASTDPLKTAVFIRKIGNVVSIAGKIGFSSDYMQYPPSGYLFAQLPLEYRPSKVMQGVCFTNRQGTAGEAVFKIEANGNTTLTTAQTTNTDVSITGFTYLAQ